MFESFTFELWYTHIFLAKYAIFPPPLLAYVISFSPSNAFVIKFPFLIFNSLLGIGYIVKSVIVSKSHCISFFTFSSLSIIK